MPQGSKIAHVRSYLRVPKAAGQVKILKFLVKIKFYPYMPIIFVMQGKCLFSDISRPVPPPFIMVGGGAYSITLVRVPYLRKMVSGQYLLNTSLYWIHISYTGI